MRNECLGCGRLLDSPVITCRPGSLWGRHSWERFLYMFPGDPDLNSDRMVVWQGDGFYRIRGLDEPLEPI